MSLELSEENFIETLLDPARREALVRALSVDNLGEWAVALARSSQATPQQLEQAGAELLASLSFSRLVLEALVARADMPEAFLLALSEDPGFAAALGRRAGPQNVLEKVADAHRDRAAIRTLARDYYGRPEADNRRFAGFVARYIEEAALMREVFSEASFPAEKRLIAQAVLAQAGDQPDSDTEPEPPGREAGEAPDAPDVETVALSWRGFTGLAAWDAAAGGFKGRLAGVPASIAFEAPSLGELEMALREAVDFYLEMLSEGEI